MNRLVNKGKLVSVGLAMGLGLLVLAAFMLLLTDPALGEFGVLASQAAPVTIVQATQDTVYAGGTITYTVTVVNVSGEVLPEGWELRDTWTTSLYDDRPVWWEDRDALARFEGYTVTPSDAVISHTETLNPERKRGEAVFTMAELPADGSVELVFWVRVSPNLQPSLNDHDNGDAFRSIVGPTSLENSIVAVIPDQPLVEAELASTMVVGPVLRMSRLSEGEDVGTNAGRIGRLITYTITLRNLEYDGSQYRPDAIPATNLVVSEELPESLAEGFLTAGATVPGVETDYDGQKIWWNFPSEYALPVGETIYLSYTLRVPVEHRYNSN